MGYKNHGCKGHKLCIHLLICIRRLALAHHKSHQPLIDIIIHTYIYIKHVHTYMCIHIHIHTYAQERSRMHTHKHTHTYSYIKIISWYLEPTIIWYCSPSLIPDFLNHFVCCGWTLSTSFGIPSKVIYWSDVKKQHTQVMKSVLTWLIQYHLVVFSQEAMTDDNILHCITDFNWHCYSKCKHNDLTWKYLLCVIDWCLTLNRNYYTLFISWKKLYDNLAQLWSNNHTKVWFRKYQRRDELISDIWLIYS